MNTCVVRDCGRPCSSWGFCQTHYDRLKRFGTPLPEREIRTLPKGATAIQRWAKNVRLPTNGNGCWEWVGAAHKLGYGAFWNGIRVERAHRWSYRVFVGEIPEGLHMDHLCRNPRCVNPEHLEPVTPKENVLRGNSIFAQKHRQTHCLKGHLLSGKNLYTWNGGRFCRACRAATREKHSHDRRKAGKA